MVTQSFQMINMNLWKNMRYDDASSNSLISYLVLQFTWPSFLSQTQIKTSSTDCKISKWDTIKTPLWTIRTSWTLIPPNFLPIGVFPLSISAVASMEGGGEEDWEPEIKDPPLMSQMALANIQILNIHQICRGRHSGINMYYPVVGCAFHT